MKACPRSLAILAAGVLIIAAAGSIPEASADTRATVQQTTPESCARSTAAECACLVAGWRQVGRIPSGFIVNSLGGSAALDRVYAATAATNDPTGQKAYSGRLGDLSWSVLPDFQRIPVTDILAGAEQPPNDVWISGESQSSPQIERPVYGATAASPTSFTQQGSLAWVTQLAAYGGKVYAASGRPKGIHVWNAAQQGWDLAGGSDIPTPAFWSLAAGGGRMWAGTDGAGLWVAPEGGATWAQVAGAGNSLQRATIRALAVDERDAGRVVIAAGLGPQASTTPADPGFRGLRISRDGGASWSNPNFEGVDLIPAIAFSKLHAGHMYVATFGQGVQASHDGGGTWWSLTPPVSSASRTYDLMTLIPSGTSSCELLLAGGDAGVWALNVAASTMSRVFLPSVQTCLPGPGCMLWSRPTPPPGGRAQAPARPRTDDSQPRANEAPPQPTAPAILPSLPPPPR
jgi:hypothetical protein